MAKLDSEEYDLRFAACRDVGHMWEYYGWRGFQRILACHNCPTIRTDNMDGKGRITGRVYKYPPGYHYKRTSKVILELRATLRREARKLARWVGPQGSGANLKLVENQKRREVR